MADGCLRSISVFSLGPAEFFSGHSDSDAHCLIMINKVAHVRLFVLKIGAIGNQVSKNSTVKYAKHIENQLF